MKRPKLYVRDPGLAAFLCGVQTVDGLRASPLAGPLWETFVCAEIRRAQSNRRGGRGYFLLLRDEYPSTDERQAVHLDLDYPDAARDSTDGCPWSSGCSRSRTTS